MPFENLRSCKFFIIKHDSHIQYNLLLPCFFCWFIVSYFPPYPAAVCVASHPALHRIDRNVELKSELGRLID